MSVNHCYWWMSMSIIVAGEGHCLSMLLVNVTVFHCCWWTSPFFTVAGECQSFTVTGECHCQSLLLVNVTVFHSCHGHPVNGEYSVTAGATLARFCKLAEWRWTAVKVTSRISGSMHEDVHGTLNPLNVTETDTHSQTTTYPEPCLYILQSQT